MRRLRASEANRVRGGLVAIAEDWWDVLADDPQHARPIVAALLNGRVTITPTTKGQWKLTGEGTLAGLFMRTVEEISYPSGWRARGGLTHLTLTGSVLGDLIARSS